MIVSGANRVVYVCSGFPRAGTRAFNTRDLTFNRKGIVVLGPGRVAGSERQLGRRALHLVFDRSRTVE
jgi:hypothetical protein